MRSIASVPPRRLGPVTVILQAANREFVGRRKWPTRFQWWRRRPPVLLRTTPSPLNFPAKGRWIVSNMSWAFI